MQSKTADEILASASIKSKNFYVIKLRMLSFTTRAELEILQRKLPAPASLLRRHTNPMHSAPGIDAILRSLPGISLRPPYSPRFTVEMRNGGAVTQLATPENETYCVDRRARWVTSATAGLTMQSKTADEILAHPRFAEARRAHIDALVGLFAGDRFVTRMMADAGVITLRGFLAGFHAAYDENDRTTWATPGQLQKLIVERGFASARRLDDLMARFRQAGYVVSVMSPVDKRIRILRPTERLLAHDRAHLAVYHRFLHDLYPDRGYDWALRQDPRVQLAIRKAAFYALPQALAFMRHVPIMMFLARDAGYLAFLLAAQAELSDRDRGPSFTSMSADLGVSRTHIRNLFVEAEAAGYVRLGRKRSRQVEIMPPLWEAYDRFVADVQADQDTIAQIAFANFREAEAIEPSRKTDSMNGFDGH